MENDSSARDVFMYLLVIVVLAMSAANLGTLLFQYINLYLPDVTLPVCTGTWCQDTIRWSLASIIVVFPVFLWAWRFLQRDVAANPQKADARIRRWLLYLMLFVSGGFIIGDFVALIYQWLQGNWTTQFVLKVVVIFYIASTIFYYFLKALHRERGYAKIVGWVAVGIVIVAIVVGFISAGSPFRVRVQKQDEQRVMDLQNIQDQIVRQYYQYKGVLPQTLDDLKNSISGFVVPVDPTTKQPYEYIRKGQLTFTLCATFATEVTTDTSSAMRQPYPYDTSTNWTHGIGRVCFDRTIDPALYPVYSPAPVPLK